MTDRAPDELFRRAAEAEDGMPVSAGARVAHASRSPESSSAFDVPVFPASFKNAGVVYAIAFDMDIEQLRRHYGDPYNNAYVEVRRVLEEHQFQWQQGSVYFGG